MFKICLSASLVYTFAPRQYCAERSQIKYSNFPFAYFPKYWQIIYISKYWQIVYFFLFWNDFWREKKRQIQHNIVDYEILMKQALTAQVGRMHKMWNVDICWIRNDIIFLWNINCCLSIYIALKVIWQVLKWEEERQRSPFFCVIIIIASAVCW